MGRDSATFWDKGTEIPSLSWDKGTTGQSEIKIRDGTRTILFSVIFCFRTSFPVLECPFPVFWESAFVPQEVPGQRNLSQDVPGQENIFVPEQRDNRMSRDPSHGNARL